MVKAIANLKKWTKKAVKAVRDDPSVIERQYAKLEKRANNISKKGKGAVAAAQAGDLLGAIKGVHETYRATVGGKKDDQWLKSNSAYKRAHNIGGKTFKAAQAFEMGDDKAAYKHAMDAARAAIGAAKLHQIQHSKIGQHAMAAHAGYKAAKGESGRGNKIVAGLTAYAEKRNAQTAPSASAGSLGRRMPSTVAIGGGGTRPR